MQQDALVQNISRYVAVTQEFPEQFQTTILAELLRSHLAVSVRLQSPGRVTDATAGVKASRKSGDSSKGPRHQLMALKNEGFFNDPKSAKEAHKELKVRGFQYVPDSVAMRLLELVRDQELKRIEDSAGKKPVMKYQTR